MKKKFLLFGIVGLLVATGFGYAGDSALLKIFSKGWPDFITSSQIKYSTISGNTSGDNTVVAAVTGKKIRVLSLYVITTDAATVAFESGASGTALTGDVPCAANGGFVLPFNSGGWFETAASALLNMELNAVSQTSGALSYIEV